MPICGGCYFFQCVDKALTLRIVIVHIAGRDLAAQNYLLSRLILSRIYDCRDIRLVCIVATNNDSGNRRLIIGAFNLDGKGAVDRLL